MENAKEMDMPRGYMNLNEAARWACVSQRTVRRWIGQGLPRYQTGPRPKVLVRPEDITAFLTKKQVPVIDLNRMVEEVLRMVS
jgi:predicted site-specific integrase-resolvase